MKASIKEVQKFIEESELVLVGIGEEFERKLLLEKEPEYLEVCDYIRQAGKEWAIPYVNTYWLRMRLQDKVVAALRNLQSMLEGKNYFLVSTCMNGFLREAGFGEERVVEPCGSYRQIQCPDGCEGSLEPADEMLLRQIEEAINGVRSWEDLQCPRCVVCKKEKIFNNLYAENYLEQGYLPQWERYMKWLQGTIKRNVCILELGEGLKYPQIIRWPFEKTAYLNKKAIFVRVHEKLYHLTPELSEQGYSVDQNAVDFFTEVL